jgi:hypothetical protein
MDKLAKCVLQNALNRSMNVSDCSYTGLQGKMKKKTGFRVANHKQVPDRLCCEIYLFRHD